MHFEFLGQGLTVMRTKQFSDCSLNFKLDQSQGITCQPATLPN